jgi:hypothetical protein
MDFHVEGVTYRTRGSSITSAHLHHTLLVRFAIFFDFLFWPPNSVRDAKFHD